MKGKKWFAFILAGALTVSVFSGCTNKPVATEDGVTKLSYWKALNANTASVVSNLGETEFAKRWQELGNVEIEFLHPPAGQADEKFSVLTASSDMPDIIEYTWVTGYPGGPGRAIIDNVIIDIEAHKEYAPNLFSYLSREGNEYKNKLAQTDEGQYFGFPLMMTDDRLAVSTGLVIRHDWLEDLNLPIPETIDEWTNTLRAFRDEKGATSPFSLVVDWYPFAYAYNIEPDYYVDGQTIKYGRAEDGFKDFLALMNSWYSEGLLDKNFMSIDSKTRDYNMLNGLTGAAFTNMGGGIGRYMSATDDPRFLLGPAPYPVLNKGDYPEYGLVQLEVPGAAAAITTSCKNVEAAMKFLDLPYDEEGDAYMLFNFGIEGKSYNMVEGYPKYTDEILNNPEGKAVPEAMSMYLTAFTSAPFLQDFRYFEQYAQLPIQKDSIELWSKTNAKNHKVPHLYAKQDELNELARLSNDVETYADEMILKFIMGNEPLSKFDEYVGILKQRGLDRLLEIKQQALNRFNAK